MKNIIPPSDLPPAYNIYEDVEYHEYWEAADKRKLNELEHDIVRELLPPSGHRILDLGCGYGRMADCYLGRFQDIVMFDGSLSLLRSAQKATKGEAHYIVGDINHLPFHSATFDNILMILVLHHLTEPAKCLNNIGKVICKDGRFVMTYRNKRNALWMAKYLLGAMSHNPFSREPLALEANIFNHHPAYVSELLAAAGFKHLIYRGAGVFDKLEQFSGRFFKWVPRGTFWAPILGNLFLAPWIFCRGIAQNTEPLKPASNIENLLACPLCKSELGRATSGFECTNCRAKYPIIDGIIDMRIEAAIS
jgi:SAM-dependent methyltransferase